jgi:hypothetical protein
MKQLLAPLRLTGLLALLGQFLYQAGDVLQLASKVDLENYPQLVPFAILLSDSQNMVLPSKQMIWGVVLDVFATTLVVAGFWQIYQGLGGADISWALVTLTVLWLLLKRILAQFVRDHTEGAGFNIAYLAVFACPTATLWNG